MWYSLEVCSLCIHFMHLWPDNETLVHTETMIRWYTLRFSNRYTFSSAWTRLFFTTCEIGEIWLNNSERWKTWVITRVYQDAICTIHKNISPLASPHLSIIYHALAPISFINMRVNKEKMFNLVFAWVPWWYLETFMPL